MSTNSILHNIVIEDKESAERLIDALEESEIFSKKGKCSRCNKPITSGAIITIDKPVYKSRLERFYTLCGYCVEDLEEFLGERGSE